MKIWWQILVWPLLLYKNNICRIGPIYKSGAKRILYQSEERISFKSFLLTSLSCLKDTHLHQSFKSFTTAFSFISDLNKQVEHNKEVKSQWKIELTACNNIPYLKLKLVLCFQNMLYGFYQYLMDQIWTSPKSWT